MFPISIRAENGMEVRSGSWNGGTLGQSSEIGSRTFTFPHTFIVDGTTAELGEVTLTGTDVATVALFRSRDIYQSKPNKVKARLIAYEFHVDTPSGGVTDTVLFKIVSVESLSGTPTYIPIDANNSIIEYDSVAGTGSTIKATAGIPLISGAINYVGSNKGGSVGGSIVDAEKLGAFAYAGDQLAILAKDLGGNGVTVRVSLTWEELF